MRDDVWRACPFLRAKNVWASCGQLMRWPRPQAAACLRDPCAPLCTALATDHGEQDCRAPHYPHSREQERSTKSCSTPWGRRCVRATTRFTTTLPAGNGPAQSGKNDLGWGWWQQDFMTSDHHSETSCVTCVLSQRRHPWLRAHRAVRRATAPPGSCATAGLVPVDGADSLASATVPPAAALRATTITVAERRNGYLTKSVCWLWHKQPLPRSGIGHSEIWNAPVGTRCSNGPS